MNQPKKIFVFFLKKQVLSQVLAESSLNQLVQ
jgi:hypothetical protein